MGNMSFLLRGAQIGVHAGIHPDQALMSCNHAHLAFCSKPRLQPCLLLLLTHLNGTQEHPASFHFSTPVSQPVQDRLALCPAFVGALIILLQALLLVHS